MSCLSLCRRFPPPGRPPMRCAGSVSRHKVGCPWMHGRHFPQLKMAGSTTWSPGFTLTTPRPTFSTTPAPSCPATTGYWVGTSPFISKRSLWHIPVATSLTITSWSCGSSRVTSSTCNGLLGPYSMAAFIFMAESPHLPAVVPATAEMTLAWRSFLGDVLLLLPGRHYDRRKQRVVSRQVAPMQTVRDRATMGNQNDGPTW